MHALHRAVDTVRVQGPLLCGEGVCGVVLTGDSYLRDQLQRVKKLLQWLFSPRAACVLVSCAGVIVASTSSLTDLPKGNPPAPHPESVTDSALGGVPAHMEACRNRHLHSDVVRSQDIRSSKATAESMSQHEPESFEGGRAASRGYQRPAPVRNKAGNA